MTLIHYIGADKPLWTGSFGDVYTLKKFSELPVPAHDRDIRSIVDLSHLNDTYVKVYETELDAAGLYIQEVTSEAWKNKLVISKPYIYVLGGSFELNEEMHRQAPASYEVCLKYFTLLLSYMDDQLEDGETLEIYSCWDGEEYQGRDASLDMTIDLASYRLAPPLEFQDKQHIMVKK